jgi:hypothetical protein
MAHKASSTQHAVVINENLKMHCIKGVHVLNLVLIATLLNNHLDLIQRLGSYHKSQGGTEVSVKF